MGTTLVLGDREQGFEQLLGLAGGRSYVAPGSADCSGLMIRLESPARAFQMPPGDPLEPELLCLVFQWIEAGAPR